MTDREFIVEVCYFTGWFWALVLALTVGVAWEAMKGVWGIVWDDA